MPTRAGQLPGIGGEVSQGTKNYSASRAEMAKSKANRNVDTDHEHGKGLSARQEALRRREQGPMVAASGATTPQAHPHRGPSTSPTRLSADNAILIKEPGQYLSHANLLLKWYTGRKVFSTASMSWENIK